jgi:hypothetical protein
MTQSNTTQNLDNTSINQPHEATIMSSKSTPLYPKICNASGARQISSIALWNEQFQAAEAMIDRGMRFHGVKPLGMLIIGETGAGKTHFAEKKMEELNKTAVDKGDYTTMPVVKVDAPKQSTISNIIQRLLFELGDIKPNAGTLIDKEHRLKALLKELGVQLVIVDEIHDFLPKTPNGKSSTALSWLKGIMDDTLIPMLFMGTERASLIKVLDKELASRIRYSITLTQVPYGTADEDKFDFADMATAFAENLPKPLKAFNFVTFIDDAPVYSNINLLDRLYVATKGVPRGLCDFILEVNVEMEDNPNFSPNLEALSVVYARLSAMNEYIEYNPFTPEKLDDVRKYIGYQPKGDVNEAA